MGTCSCPIPWRRSGSTEVAARVLLSGLDFENFATDMLADRAFIEEHAALCGVGEVLRCLLVRRRGGDGGVLVLPERGAFVGWAALENWKSAEPEGSAFFISRVSVGIPLPPSACLWRRRRRAYPRGRSCRTRHPSCA